MAIVVGDNKTVVERVTDIYLDISLWVPGSDTESYLQPKQPEASQKKYLLLDLSPLLGVWLFMDRLQTCLCHTYVFGVVATSK